MRTLSIFAAMLIAASASAGMAEQPTQRFVYGDDTYVYTASVDGDGHRVLEGQRFPSQERFHYVIANGKVSGWSGNSLVRFDVVDAEGAARFGSR